ncbi:MAG: hypothetical protein JWN26_411 [Candidatus Saccharibacteria bacterium]|nr:hypothetical protein [Candidatus Saccharibacteria bacterium]
MYSTVAMQPVLNVPEIVPIINSDLSGADTTSRIIPTSIKVEPSKQTIPSVSSPVPPLQNLVKTVVDPSLTVATNAIVNTPLIDVNATSGCVSLLAIEACLK